jgi:hypothetical protein
VVARGFELVALHPEAQQKHAEVELVAARDARLAFVDRTVAFDA